MMVRKAEREFDHDFTETEESEEEDGDDSDDSDCIPTPERRRMERSKKEETGGGEEEEGGGEKEEKVGEKDARVPLAVKIKP